MSNDYEQEDQCRCNIFQQQNKNKEFKENDKYKFNQMLKNYVKCEKIMVNNFKKYITHINLY